MSRDSVSTGPDTPADRPTSTKQPADVAPKGPPAPDTSELAKQLAKFWGESPES